MGGQNEMAIPALKMQAALTIPTPPSASAQASILRRPALSQDRATGIYPHQRRQVASIMSL